MSKTRNLADVASGTITGNLSFSDNEKAILGDGDDLQIYHNGSDSYVDDTGTGALILRGNSNVTIGKYTGETMGYFETDGAVSLYHDNAIKLATTATGVDVTGTVQADQFNNDEALPDIRPSLLLDFANSKTLDPRITFTRGSTATYWDGKTTGKAEENLLSYSQDLSNAAWLVSGTTVTANNTAAPDGTTTAEKVAISTEGDYRNISQRPTGLASTAYTLSVYLKKSNWDYVSVNLQSRTSSNGYINTFGQKIINLSNGTTIGNDIGTATTTDVGNGWYRVTVSGTSASNAEMIYIDFQFTNSSGQAAPSTSVANGSAIFLWGAQLEQRSAATAYTATTSSPIVKYQPVLQTAASGAARFDHDPVTGESKGLLIEEARTNLATHSKMNESLDNFNRGTVFANSIIAPDGTQTANVYREDTANGAHHIQEIIPNETANTVHTASVYVKNYGVSDCQLAMRISDSGDVYKKVFFDLDNIVVSFSGDTGYTGTITDVGNGWRRLTITGDVGDGTNDLRVHLFNCQGTGTTSSYTGNGWDGLGFWGLQVEVGSFATSHIPTTGAAATRAGELTSVLTSTVMSAHDGSIYVESTSGPAGWDTTGQYNLFQFGDSNADGLGVFKESGSKKFWYHARRANSSFTNVNGSLAWADNTTSKVVLGFNNSSQRFYVDGTLIGTEQTAALTQLDPNQVTELNIGTSGNAAYHQFNGYIKKVACWPKRLSNATLQAMTTE